MLKVVVGFKWHSLKNLFENLSWNLKSSLVIGSWDSFWDLNESSQRDATSFVSPTFHIFQNLNGLSPQEEHCGACKLWWWSGGGSPIFLPWHGNASLPPCITSYFHLHCRVAAGQGRSYHIRVTSERSIPIRANPRNSHPLCNSPASLHIALHDNPPNPSLLSWAPLASHPKCIFFAEKEQLLQPLVDVDIVKMRKTPRIVFALPLSSTGAGGGGELHFCNLDFTRFSLSFLLLPSCPSNLLLLWTCPASRVVASFGSNQKLFYPTHITHIVGTLDQNSLF